MSNTIQQDPRRAAGYAWIELAVLLSAEPIRFRIERDHPSKPYLGPQGWQATSADLKPGHQETIDSGVRLHVGPSVVNHIPEFEQITILLPDLDFSAQLVWPPIPPLRSGHRAVVDGPAMSPEAAPAEPASAKPPLSPPQAETAAEPAQDQQAELIGRPSMDPAYARIALDDVNRPSRTTPIIFASIFGLILLIAAGFLAWYLYQQPFVQDLIKPEQVAQQQAPPPVANGTERPEAERPVVPNAPPASPPPQRTARERILDPNTPADQLYQLGVDLNKGGSEERGLGFEAIFRSADRNYGEAALWMARAYDPRLEIWRQVFGDRANPGNALRYYRRAANLGMQEANTDERALCDWLKQRPGGGSDEEKSAHETYCATR
jgi:hypothetical protein